MTRTKMDEKTRKLTAQISLALVAGMVSFAPHAYALPTLDKVVSGGADVNKTDTLNMSITSKNANNVIDWVDFSIAKGETVGFDNNNYMNIVTGSATSAINGNLNGGGDIYLINPNGVIFGKDASVNVGNLYVSTQADMANVSDYNAGVNQFGAVDYAPGNVVNMGNISADKVAVVGHNISFENSANVVKKSDTSASADVNLTALKAYTDKNGSTEDGYIHIGHASGSSVPSSFKEATYTYEVDKDTKEIAKKEIARTDLTDSEKYTLVSTYAELQAMNTSTNYMLADDVNAEKSDGTKEVDFAPIAGKFTGNFDGMYHQLKNFTIKAGTDNYGMSTGLFESINGSRIENLGFINLTVNGGTRNSGYIIDRSGAIAGNATKATIKNVFVDQLNGTSQITGASSYTGGLVGVASSSTVSSAYFIGKSSGGAFIGNVDANTSIKDVYSKGTVYGFIASTSTDSKFSNISNSYTYATNLLPAGRFNITPSSGYSSVFFGATDTNVTGEQLKNGSNVEESITKTNTITTYTGANGGGWSISNTGGLQYANGKYYRPTWRIYEGKTLPLLTAFFKGTVQADYTVTMGEGTVNTQSNVANLGNSESKTILPSGGTTAFTLEGNGNVSAIYNGQTPTLSGVTFYGANNDSSLIKNNSFDVLNSKNVGTYYLFSSAQDGYDIAGDKIEITKRSLGLSQTDNINLPLTKEYDGTATLTAANASDVLTIDSSTGGTTGIIGDDKVTLGGTVDATFYDNSKDKNLSPNVGKNKYVEATFKSVTLTGTDAANYSVGGTGDIKVTSTAGMITPRNITVSLENSTGIDKTYDGTTDVSSDSAGKVTNNINDKRLGSDNLKLVDLTATDKTAEVSTYAGQYNDKNASDAAEDKTITYKGIALSGDETTLANYRIVDGKGNVLYYNPGSTSNGFDAVNTTDGGTLTGTGTITRRYIDQSAFNDPEITKVYDNTNTGTIDSAIELTQTRVSTDNAKTEKSGIIDGDDLSFNIAAGTTVYYLDKDGNQSDEAKNATGYNGDDSGAQKAQYSVSVTGNDLKNYTWDSSDTNIKEAVADSFDRTTDNAKITKRNIILSYTGTDKPSKVYDGDNIVKALDSSNQYTEQAFIDKATTYITYGQNTDKANQLLKDADSSNDDGTTYSVSGRYDDANVAYKAGTTNYTEDDVAEKTVSYNIVLKNNTATKLGNYTVNGKALTIDTTKNTAQSSDAALTDTGKITPAHITNVTFADATKEYDGTDVNTYASPTDGAMEVNGVTGIVSADTTKGITAADIIDVTGATGTYGTGEGTNFVASSHVKDVNDANGKVKYTGFKLKDTTAAHNYLLEPTEAYGKGKITQKTIGTSDVTVNFGEIKKVYDGTKALKKDAKDYIKSITINAIAGDTISKDDLTASAEYDTEDVNAKKANYTIKFSGTGSDVSDYKFEGGTLSTDADASITVRPVYVKVNDGYKTGVNKTYDGTQQLNGKYDLTKAISVVDNTGDDTGLITGANADGVTLDTSADTVGGKNGPYDSKNAGDRTLTYNVSLKDNGSGDDVKNYVVYNYDDINKADKTAITTLTGTGTIAKRGVKVSFGDVAKYYDTTADVKNNGNSVTGGLLQGGGKVNGTDKISATLTLVSADGDVADRNALVSDGIADSADPSSAKNVSGVTGTFGVSSGSQAINDVASDSSWTAGDKTITYANVSSIFGDNSSNYDIQDANGDALKNDTAYGKGTIAKLKLDTNNFTYSINGSVSKVYDKTADVDHYEMSGNDLVKKTSYDYLTGVTLNGTDITAKANDTDKSYTMAGAYQDSTSGANDAQNAGENKTISYTMTLGDKIAKNVDASTYSYSDNTNGVSASGSNDGKTINLKTTKNKITKREINVTAKKNVAPINKVYDGTTDVKGSSVTIDDYFDIENNADATKKLTGIIAGDTAKITLDGASHYTSSDATATPNAEGKYYDEAHVEVALKLDGNSNYTLSNGTATINGNILRRGVVLSIESDVNKVYDGANNTGLGIDESGKTWTNSDLLSIDKTVADVSTTNNGIIAADVDKVSLNADGFTTNYYRTGTDTKDGNADVNGSTHDVVSKLNQGATGLTGDAAQNYYLIDSEGNAVSSIKTTGKITPRTINKVVFADVSKTYDGNNNVTNTKTGGTYPTNDVITITGVTDDSGNSVIQGDDKIENIFRATDKITGEYGHSNTAGESSGFVGTPNATKNTDGGANTARYTNIGKALTNKNYQLANSANTQYGKGTINQRAITATLGSDLRNDLSEDGTMFEREYNTEKYGVKLDDLKLDGTAIVTGDESKVALAKKGYSTITADGVVAETSSADADEYSLTYDVELSGDKAKNYALSVVAPTKAKIDKRAIKVTIGANSKDYDGDVSVGKDNISAKVGLVDDKNNVNDALKIEIGNLDKEYNSGNVITGTYGTYSTVTEQNGKKTATASDTFNENGDVSRSGITTASDVYTADADKKYGYKAVKYEGMDTALANAKYADDRSYSKNYEITEVVGANGDATKTMTTGNSSLVSTAYFNEAAEQGIIRPIAITNAATVNKTWTGDIVKTYDGTTDVKNPKDYLKLSYTVNGKDYAIDSYDVGKVYYNDKNVATANSVTYEGISFKPTVEDNPNLDFTDLNKDGTIPIGNETLNNGDTINGTKYRVAIEKRTVNLVLPDTSIDKTYDGTTDVSDADKAKFSYEATKNETGLIAGDDVAVNYSNIVYDGANAKYDLDGNQLSNGETNNVSYTATLAGADKDNYQLSNDNGNIVSDSITGSVAGKIFQRAVYVDFTDDAKKAFASTDADGYKGIVKKYDGETTVPDAYSGEKAVQLAGGNGRSANDADGKTTGIVDTGVTLDSVDEAYESSNVARDKNGNVQSQDVYYTAFKLKDSSGKNLDKNYVVKTSESNYRGTVNNADALVGTGTIAPIKVKVAVKDGISKVYDGKSDLVSRDMQGNTIKDYGTFDQIDYSSDDATLILNGGSLDAKLSDAKTIQGAIAIDKSYFINKDDNEDANVASAVGVDYYLKYNSNFELIKVGTNSSTKPTELSTQTLTARLRGDGSITPRTLKVDDIAGVSKVYDGTSDFNGAVDVKFNDAIADADSLGIKATGGTFYDSTGTDKVKDAGSNYVVKDMSIDATNLNSNYQLVDADGKNLTTASGLTTGATSEIERATVVVTPVNVSLPAGQKLDPSYEFTGNFSDLSNSVKGYNEDREKFGDFTYDLLDRVPAQNGTSGTYQIYSWQDKGKTNEVTKAGLELGGDEYKNYRFVLGDGFLTIAKPDDPHHPVNPVDPNRPVRPSDIIKDITNKDIPEHEIDRYEESVRDATRFVPDDRSYFRASYDEDEAHYGRKPVIDLIAHNGGVNLGDEATLDYDGSIGVESDAPTLVGGSVSVDGDRLSIASSNVTFADEDSALSTLSNGVTTNEAEAVAREAANAASEANMSESANAATPRVRMGRYMTSTVAESESTAASTAEELPTASVSETEPVTMSAASEAIEPSETASTTRIMSRESTGVYDAESGSYDTYLSAGEGEASEPETWTARYEREQAASTGITINSKDDDDDDESSLDDKALVASNLGNIGIETRGMGVNLSALG